MDGCSKAGTTVADEHGSAVCDAYAASHGAIAGDDGVALKLECVVVVKGGRDDVDGGAVDLAKEEDSMRLHR